MKTDGKDAKANSSMASIKTWVLRRCRMRYLLLIGTVFIVIVSARTLLSKAGDVQRGDENTAPKNGNAMLRRGPKVNDNINIGLHSDDGRHPAPVVTEERIVHRPGEQVLRDNVLEEAFIIPTTQKTTSTTKLSSVSKHSTSSFHIGRTYNTNWGDIKPREIENIESIKRNKEGIKESKDNFPKNIKEEPDITDNRNQEPGRSTPKGLIKNQIKDDNILKETKDERTSNEEGVLGNVKNVVQPGKIAEETLDTVDLKLDDLKNLRHPITDPPWMRTRRPIHPEDYAKNCTSGSLPVQGGPFHTGKFCLVDDSREYFSNYGGQLCYHRGTDKHKTRRRIKKHHTCECFHGWHGKYCSMPDVVFNGGYPYEYGTERQSPPRRVIFAFPFNGEFAMLETMVRSLHSAVDVFLILESNYTAAGQPKERVLLKKLQNRYLPEMQYKIVYIPLDYFPRAAYSNGWVIDALLRNHIWEVASNSILENLRDDDIIVSTDADEIMTEEALMFLKLHYGYPEPFSFILKHSVFGYFWQAPDEVTNSFGGCSIAMLRQILRDRLYDVRNAPKNIGRDASFLMKFKRRTGIKVKPWAFGSKDRPAGWHCSWCFLPDGIRNKLISAHASDFPRWGTFPDKTNLPFIFNLVKNGTWFDEKTKLTPIWNTYDSSFAPQYIRDNEKTLGYLLDLDAYVKMSRHSLDSENARISDQIAKYANR